MSFCRRSQAEMNEVLMIASLPLKNKLKEAISLMSSKDKCCINNYSNENNRNFS